jgi:hypothetical protein
MRYDAPIPIPDDLKKLFEIPSCEAVALPDASDLKLRLPNGSTFSPIADLSKGFPTDCSLTVNLFIQLAPFLASIECLLKVLGLLKPLIDVVKSLGPPPDPIKLPNAIADFVKAAEALLPCFGMIMPSTNIFFFLKDLILLIIKIIKCMIGQLQTILGIMQGIEIRLADAQTAGNTELQRVLECAKKNAATAANHAQSSLGPVQNLMPLIGFFLDLAGIKLEIPPLGSAEDSAALEQTIETLNDTITTLENVVESLP